MASGTAYRAAVGLAIAAALLLVCLSLGVGIIGAIAVFGGLGRPWSGPLELILLNGFFVALFLASAWLFRRAAPAAP